MANVPKAITDLPVASAMGDDDLLVVSQNATTSSIKGELIKGYAQNAVAPQVTAAQTAATQASRSATQAEAARQGAAAAQTAAENAQDAAETARDQSVAAAGTIGDSVGQAQTAAGQASSAKDAAVAAQSAAETAKTAAETASGQAQTAATQASGSATAAQTAATQAGDAKTDAETARNEAETSASSAANSASDAESAATEAEQAKTYIENMDMEGETLPAGSSVTVTKTTSPGGNLLFVIGVPQGIQGDKGDTGETGATGPQGVSITNATVNEDGDLVITLSAGDPINAGSVIGPQGIQGDVGPTGASVDRIERTSGTGAPGTTDTYTVYLTNGQTSGTFQVYNGQNGTGTGDFMASGFVPMTGDLNMGGHRITNVSAPTQPTDAVRQSDLEAVSQEVDHILDGTTPAYIPPATTTKIGGVIVGDGIEVGADGTISTNPVPEGGTEGQVLTKTSTGEEWSDAPSGLPEGGSEGQVIKKTADGAEWGNADWLPLSGGTVNGYINFDQAKSGIYFSKFQDEHNCYPTIRSTTIDGKVALSIYSKAHNGVSGAVYPIILSGVDTPKRFNDAANKIYVDDELNNLGAEISNELDTKLTTPTGTQGQLLGFTADNTVGAVDAPESGLTQEQADERYLQLNSDAMITGDITFKYGADFDGSKITSVGTPVNGSDGANKAYVDSKAPISVTVTLTADGWVDATAVPPPDSGGTTVTQIKRQTVTVSGVVASETAQLITPTPAIASQSAYYEAGIMCTNQGTNSLTFTCQTVPTSNLTVYVVIQPLSYLN